MAGEQILRVKVLLDHSSPYLLAHGGYSVLIDYTAEALRAAGLEVEFLRWWDHEQRADLIHYFAPVQIGYLRQARLKGIPVVLTSLVDWPANQPRWQTRRRRLIYETVSRLPLLGGVRQSLYWQSFRLCARNVVCMQCEKDFLVDAYDVDPSTVDVVSPGLQESFLQAGAGPRDGDYLVCTATIAPRKCTVRLAQIARQAQVPILFIGRPYNQADAYWKEFAALIDGRYVRYEGNVEGDAALIGRLQHARGFVFMSRVESWCFAASEAAACGLPLLLPRLNWAVERFGDQASYFPTQAAGEAEALREFYERCPASPAPAVKLLSWPDVGRRLQTVYASCL
jgi:glycosyltransferase involved in cell wall biosynthesis